MVGVDYKTFDRLKIDGFKRVNLISGKNNLGKTALLEAIRLNLSSINPQNLVNTIRDIFNKRSNNIEFDFFNKEDKEIVIFSDFKKNKMLYNKKENLQVVDFFIDEKNYQMSTKDLMQGGILLNQYMIDKINFISTKSIDVHYLSNLYATLVAIGKDDFLDKSLQIFDNNILTIRQTIQGVPSFRVKTNDREKPMLLNSLGDGINRFMAIICAIWASQDGYLFIDEVENGIHYTNYSKLWKIIFEVSKEANCQVFATTHSKECIEAFNKQNQDNEAAFIELYKNKKDEIVAKVRDFEQLEYSLTHGGSFRGE